MDDAKQDLVEAVKICRGDGVRGDLARALTSLGQIERDTHRSETAIQQLMREK